MGVEPTQDGSTAPQTVLKTAPVTGPEAAPLPFIIARDSRGRSHSGAERLRHAADHFFNEIGIRGDAA